MPEPKYYSGNQYIKKDTRHLQFPRKYCTIFTLTNYVTVMGQKTATIEISAIQGI